MRRRTKDHGTSLLEEFDRAVTEHRDRADVRAATIKERLAELEAEQADLRQLLRRLEAAGGAA